jgi:hypothetical protein
MPQSYVKIDEKQLFIDVIGEGYANVSGYLDWVCGMGRINSMHRWTLDEA